MERETFQALEEASAMLAKLLQNFHICVLILLCCLCFALHKKLFSAFFYPHTIFNGPEFDLHITNIFVFSCTKMHLSSFYSSFFPLQSSLPAFMMMMMMIGMCLEVGERRSSKLAWWRRRRRSLDRIVCVYVQQIFQSESRFGATNAGVVNCHNSILNDFSTKVSKFGFRFDWKQEENFCGLKKSCSKLFFVLRKCFCCIPASDLIEVDLGVAQTREAGTERKNPANW